MQKTVVIITVLNMVNRKKKLGKLLCRIEAWEIKNKMIQI